MIPVRPRWGRGAAPLAALALAGCAEDGERAHLSFLDPQGPVAAQQSGHFWLILAMLAIVVLPVFVLTPLFALRYRYGAGRTYRPRWSFYWPLEIVVWAVPVAIVGVLATALWINVHELDPYEPLASDRPPLRVQVVGLDWKWLFIYPEQGVASVGEMAFPADRPVALKLTSGTVMHSFLVPALGGQIYAMAGMVTRLHLAADAPGAFRGLNTQYSGEGFHEERFIARALEPEAFAAWVDEARARGVPLDEAAWNVLARRGTTADVERALSGAEAPEQGVVRFSGVPGDLFERIVAGGRVDPGQATLAPSGPGGMVMEHAGMEAGR